MRPRGFDGMGRGPGWARHRLVALVVVGVACAATLAACGGDGAPSAFAADPGPIDPALVPALDEGVDVAAVPAPQRRFLEHCVMGGDGELPDIGPTRVEGLLAVCGCTYDAVVAHLRQVAATGDGDADAHEKAAYEAFLDIEDDLRSGLALSDEIEAIAAGCVRSEAGF